ncbi:FtsQ-type POTRA domain-containing protein [Leptolyngbyaceae cyanobacterium CCMR0082]|uniref:FtsQ-type POTRA domain-containing protein n=2 Tax=Adonisia turfae TaxID=2950184 RepID=A0A6M0SJ37_9CYAN|nr:FtsQ-type POTRA domain-containing protein [Adonisia turfae]MDV3350819.1 FtsQ-type POTRA domain-containing protein [Leptothoe sp. LEGE 181152]NEZ57206.1 cell division protein FtsQ/DivIB [Adonisia turfae CCMR0081]NEZ67981.1 FtsQ-type POTRA domain-containing protein [Adonisia turfae CCMR0082]
MPDIPEYSQATLASRRQDLKQRRQRLFWQQLWRQTAMVGLTLGCLSLATSNRWHIHSTEQINLSGNQLLPDEEVYELIDIDYPKSLLKVRPLDLEHALTDKGPIEDAIVRRRLLPPGLNIRIRERTPVAIALPNVDVAIKSLDDDPQSFSQMGLLDANGYWMPYNSFTQLGSQEPKLQVQGMRPAYQKHWSDIYQMLQKNPVSVSLLDWRDPANLILHTDLGIVHMGPYGQNFSKQLTALDRMRNLNAKMNIEEIAFIDLRNPDNPTLEILQATKTQAP